MTPPEPEGIDPELVEAAATPGEDAAPPAPEEVVDA